MQPIVECDRMCRGHFETGRPKPREHLAWQVLVYNPAWACMWNHINTAYYTYQQHNKVDEQNQVDSFYSYLY